MTDQPGSPELARTLQHLMNRKSEPQSLPIDGKPPTKDRAAYLSCLVEHFANRDTGQTSAELHEAARILRVSPEIARLKAIIERERTAAVLWIQRARAEINRRRGISESRGPYEWDDNSYFKEFGAALEAIDKALGRAERETHARDFTDTPATQAEVDAARASLASPPSSSEPVTPIHQRESDATQGASSQRIAKTMAGTSDQLSPELLPALPSSSPPSPHAARKHQSPSVEMPMQPIVPGALGGMRFRANLLVRYLLDHGGLTMNDLACVPDVPDDQRAQFAELIGYSLSGYSDLSYVTDARYERASSLASTTSEVPL